MGIIKKFYISILTVILLVLTFGTVTFAWISLSTVNNIEGLSLSATSGEELQISLDGVEFTNNLTNEQLESLFSNITLNEITSIDGKIFSAGGSRKSNDINDERDYLQFDIWFRTTEDVHQVYVINNQSDEVAFDTSSTGTYIVSRGVNWRSDRTFTYGSNGEIVEVGDEAIYYASDAVRLSFVELQDDLNVLDQREEDDLISWIFDPSGDAERGYGTSYGAYSYFTEKTRNYILLPTTVQPVKYDLTIPDPRNPYQALDNESMVAVLQDTGLVTEDELPIYQGKIRITLWVEGWDADAFDAIDGDRLKIQLQFKLLNPVEA
ncbi:MAG: hypothetical protein WCR19_03860 [Acholeplasmataceae bacterium]